MKRELKVGMRGRIYGMSQTGIDVHLRKCVIHSIINEHWVNVIIDSISSQNSTLTIHRRQFVPFKEKKKPREFWVNVYKETVFAYLKKDAADRYAALDRLECILVKEVVGK